MPIGAIIGAGAVLGGSLISGNAQSKAAKSAANTATATAASNNALTASIYNQNQQTLNPFVQSGYAAGGQINALLGLDGDQEAANNAFDVFRKSTGYDFRVDQGMDAVNSGYAGSGMLRSGAALKGLDDYRQDMASNEFEKYLVYLRGQQGVGLTGASALAGVGQDYASDVSANNNSAGTAIANSQLARGNSPVANSLGTIGGAILGGVEW